MSEHDHEDSIQYLAEEGAVNIQGVDKDGELIYSFNLEILQKVHPPLYEVIVKDIDDSLLDLYKKGLIEVEYNENLEAGFKLSPIAREILSDEGYRYLFDEN